MSGAKNFPLAGPGRRVLRLSRTLAAAFFPRLPPYLIFFVTHRCNAHCPFCFVPGWPAPPAGSEELSPAEIEKIAASWPGLLHVTLTGGEPFLREDLPAIAAAFLRTGAFSLSIATNGILTGRIAAAVGELLSFRPDLLLDLNLSLDGPAEVHNRLRGVPGAYEAAWETAQKLAPLQEKFPGFRLGVTVTVSGLNAESAPTTVSELISSRLFRRVQAVWVRGRPWLKPLAPTSLEESGFEAYCRCVELLKDFSGPGIEGRIKNALAHEVRQSVIHIARQKRLPFPCRAGETLVELDAFGRVYPCEMLWQLRLQEDSAAGIDSWELGSLREWSYQLRPLLASPRGQRIKEWIHASRCVCTFECALYNSLVFTPRAWPRSLWRLFSRKAPP